MKKILLVGSFLLATVSASMAQQADRFGGFGHFFVGYTGFGDQKFYDKVVKNNTGLFNFPEPKAGALVLGGEGYDVFNSVLIGGELNVTLGNKAEQSHTNLLALGNEDDYKFKLGTRRVGAAVLVNAGYIVLHKKNFVVYPLVGIGYAASGHILSDPRSSNILTGRSYPGTTEISEQNALYYNHNLAFNAAVGVNYFVHSGGNDDNKGFNLGLRFGYQSQMANNKYNVNDIKLENASNYAKSANNGWYVRLAIGGGALHRK
ncbi:hypothetical protein SAMN05421780_10593 [Flexibacter flexilis DSM 6793]|uniref:Outer membrane protein beta-barrel domain-containing protein n=1 Tax=Flexibacter flexilis DSM 6793 TaxID=927664 RepID=A0A1I1ITS6_9BACT|nr:hypothetical protein [Flexibacter flexilis]SFC39709.1 hypothetical protein SAMN05421780_10593 [Flexibacter flexilis DSM 6793]